MEISCESDLEQLAKLLKAINFPLPKFSKKHQKLDFQQIIKKAHIFIFTKSKPCKMKEKNQHIE